MNDHLLAEILWREACRSTSLDGLCAALVGQVPGLGGLRILTIDLPAGLVQAVGWPGEPSGHWPLLSQSRAEGHRLVRWLAEDRIRHLAAGAALPGPLGGCADLLPDRPCWVVPLGAGAAALVVLDGPHEAYPGGEGFLPMLLREPLAAALGNHRRRAALEDLQRRHASERESLLSRLGRDEVLEDVIGLDGGLRTVMQRVEMVAGSDVPVLLLGETGSGKEVIARVLHRRSRRVEGPFVRVNCGAIPPDLVDSELFGHEPGSFTGAVGRRLGWFERAHGGTLLLDEIGELPRAAQVRLLRVLQDGILQRVGAEHDIQVDVRVIAATHADLAGMVQAGDFREDLWYRLAVFPLLLPPLRERRQDIPALVDMLARRAARKFGFRVRQPDPGGLAMLLEYPWPGNVRELGSVIDRAVILGGGQGLAIPAALGSSGGQGPPPRPATMSASAASPAEVRPLDEVIVRHLELALASTRGRIEGPGGCARLLALNPNTLRSRLRRHGIDPGAFRPASGEV